MGEYHTEPVLSLEQYVREHHLGAAAISPGTIDRSSLMEPGNRVAPLMSAVSRAKASLLHLERASLGLGRKAGSN
jgi:hypothetical protein